MLGTLRFRLTALFLLVVLVFGLVSMAFALRLFQDVTRSESVSELKREAAGLADLYAESALRSSDEGARAPEFAAKNLELATGDELYYVGASLFPGQRFGLTRLTREALGGTQLDPERVVTFEFTPPGEGRLCWLRRSRCSSSVAPSPSAGWSSRSPSPSSASNG